MLEEAEPRDPRNTIRWGCAFYAEPNQEFGLYEHNLVGMNTAVMATDRTCNVGGTLVSGPNRANLKIVKIFFFYFNYSFYWPYGTSTT